MALSQRIDSLKKRHLDIEEQLHLEEARPSQDEARVAQLKKDKLSLKDEIVKLASLQEAAA